jgi:rubredoxin
MITVTPFEGEFCQKVRTIYSINNCNPESAYSHMTTSAECPHCKTRNIFRVYEPKDEYETKESYVAIYDCKCPNCGKDFEIKDEFEKEED